MGRASSGMAMVALALAACAPQVPPRPTTGSEPPPEFPAAHYRQAVASGQAVFEIEPARSLVVIEVRRAGSLSQLGHDHVIASHDVRGFVAPDAGRADLYLRLDALTVDEPDLRAAAKFDGQPPAAAIEGTRENMLGKLRAGLHPYALVAIAGTDAGAAGTPTRATLTLNGTARTVPVAVAVERATDAMSVSGHFIVAQTDFAIAPYSILGGALQVEDKVAVRFTIRARRISP